MEKVLKKLGFKGQSPAIIMGAPEDIYNQLKKALATEVVEHLMDPSDYILFFTRDLASFQKHQADLMKAATKEGYLWVVYPKKTSKKYRSDLSRDILWPMLGPYDYEPVSQFAVDEDWSAMRFRHVSQIKRLTRQTASSALAKERLDKEAPCNKK